MKLSTRILTVVLLVAGASTAVYAYSRHGGWHMTPQEKAEFIGERVGKKLDLTVSQQENFDALADLVAGIVVEVRADKRARMDEIEAMLDEPSFNQARALELIEQKTGMINEKAPLVISSLAVFLDSLTAEQKDQLQQFIEHRRHHHDHHRHGNGGEG